MVRMSLMQSDRIYSESTTQVGSRSIDSSRVESAIDSTLRNTGPGREPEGSAQRSWKTKDTHSVDLCRNPLRGIRPSNKSK
jgi:hypothetical protein